MIKAFTTGLLNTDPQVTVFNGPPAENVARKYGLLDSMRDWVRAEVARTGTTQRMIATQIQGPDFIGAVYWGGFDDPQENGIVCCVGRCTKPEDVPIVLMKLVEFFACAMHPHPSPWTVN
jgi:hypothetical protein